MNFNALQSEMLEAGWGTLYTSINLRRYSFNNSLYAVPSYTQIHSKKKATY
jgi:hypothetical protein